MVEGDPPEPPRSPRPHRLIVVGAGRGHGVRLADYPDVWRQQRGDTVIELPLTYRFAPGEPLDGATMHVPLSGLNQVRSDGLDWQIPGYRSELVTALVRSLPKDVRRRLIPFGETIDAVLERLWHSSTRSVVSLVEALAVALRDAAGVEVAPTSFDRAAVPDHLQLHIVVSDDDGTVHAVGTDLDAIKAQLAGSVRASIVAAAPIEERRGITSWISATCPASSSPPIGRST